MSIKLKDLVCVLSRSNWLEIVDQNDKEVCGVIASEFETFCHKIADCEVTRVGAVSEKCVKIHIIK